jgi:hypothetical protein
MRKAIVALLASVVTGLLTGCAITGYHHAAQSRIAIDRARVVTADIRRELDAAGAALRNLTAPQSTDLRPYYDSFAAAVTRLDAKAARLEPSRQTVIAHVNAYVTAWQQELPAYRDADLRRRSAQRREQVIESIRRLDSEFHASQNALIPALISLKDVRRYLATDLTASGVITAQPQIERVGTETANVQQQLQALLAELERVGSELSPVRSSN